MDDPLAKCRKCRMTQHTSTARSCYFCGSADVERPSRCSDRGVACADHDADDSEGPHGYSGYSTD